MLWLLAAGFWTLIGLLYIGQIWWLTRTPGVRVVLTRATWVWQFGFYVAWIPSTVFIWRFTQRWTPARLGWARVILQHVALLIAISALQASAVTIAAKIILQEKESMWLAVTNTVRSRMYLQTVMYLAVVMTHQTLQLYERSRRRELDAAQLAAELAAAQLQSLRAQLHPHFLFNSLHTVASLVRDQRNAEAVTLISGLSGLLRRVLDTKADTHAIEDELAIGRMYLDIQHVRFSDRLTSRVSLSPSAAHARVPVLVVQPLVDNALRHGLADQVEPGTVSVDVTRDGADVVIRVEDTGRGAAPNWQPSATDGTGLANIRERMRVLYGDRGSVVAAGRPSGGFGVTIRLPYTT